MGQGDQRRATHAKFFGRFCWTLPYKIWQRVKDGILIFANDLTSSPVLY
jgi:hypothetical protein